MNTTVTTTKTLLDTLPGSYSLCIVGDTDEPLHAGMGLCFLSQFAEYTESSLIYGIIVRVEHDAILVHIGLPLPVKLPNGKLIAVVK